jgi:hypothetical protein
MQQSFAWEANRSSDSQEILCVVWDLQVHYRAQNSLQHVPVLIEINSVPALPILFLESNGSKYT